MFLKNKKMIDGKCFEVYGILDNFRKRLVVEHFICYSEDDAKRNFAMFLNPYDDTTKKYAKRVYKDRTFSLVKYVDFGGHYVAYCDDVDVSINDYLNEPIAETEISEE